MKKGGVYMKTLFMLLQWIRRFLAGKICYFIKKAALNHVWKECVEKEKGVVGVNLSLPYNQELVFKEVMDRIDDGIPTWLKCDGGNIAIIHGSREGKFLVGPPYDSTIIGEEELYRWFPPGDYELLCCYSGLHEDFGLLSPDKKKRWRFVRCPYTITNYALSVVITRDVETGEHYLLALSDEYTELETLIVNTLMYDITYAKYIPKILRKIIKG